MRRRPARQVHFLTRATVAAREVGVAIGADCEGAQEGEHGGAGRDIPRGAYGLSTLGDPRRRSQWVSEAWSRDTVSVEPCVI
jgi:hypothetical protein